MMNCVFPLLAVAALAEGFTCPSYYAKHQSALFLKKRPVKQGYVPKGFSPEEWAFFKARERRENNNKKKHFRSRPMVDFQKDLEAGKVRHLFPVLFAKERIQKGELNPAQVPYEQRLGSYDNSDVNNGYVPTGLSVHEWHVLQRAEKRALQAKQFAKKGPKGFMSRSLQAFQEDLERGKVTHLFPNNNTSVKKEDIPYMRRGGSWDNSDIKGASKLEWTDTDRRLEFLPDWLKRGPLAP